MVSAAECLWSERCQRTVTAPGELLEGAMEHRLSGGVRNVDAVLSAVGKRGEVSKGPLERAQPGSLGDAGLLWGLGTCAGSWEGCNGGGAGESLQAVVPVCPGWLTARQVGGVAAKGRGGGLRKGWELWGGGRGSREQLLSGPLLATALVGVFREAF